MANYFLESSGLVKRYVLEMGTAWVQDLCSARAGHLLHVVRIAGAEVVASLVRRARENHLSKEDATAAVTRFKENLRRQYQVIEVSEPLVDRAMVLIEKHGLRGYDGVQLAAACELHDIRKDMNLPELVVVSADTKLNEAARAEGLTVDDPKGHALTSETPTDSSSDK